MPLRRLVGSSLTPFVVTCVGIVAILMNSGMSPLTAGRYGVYLAGAVALPGVFVWRWLLASFHTTDGEAAPTWLEDLSLGTIFGFGIQLPLYLLGVALGVPLLFLLLPAAVVAVSVATPFGRRGWDLPTRSVDTRVSWALGVVILYGVGYLARNAFIARPLRLAPNQTPSVDETYHQALISELLHHFPPQVPYLLGTPLDYHWFAHAQLAATVRATSIHSDLLLRQLFPTTLLALTVVGLAAVALRLSGRPVAAVIAPAALVFGGFYLMGPHYDKRVFSEPFLTMRLMSSPSQAYGFVMALPAIALILEVLRPDRIAGRRTWLALVTALFALSGAKATFVPIFLVGAVVVWLFRLVADRTFDRTAAALVGLLCGVLLFAQVVLFGGSSGGLSFSPFETLQAALRNEQITDTPFARVAMGATLLIGWLLYGVGAVGLCRNGRWRDPRAIWLLASIPPGVIIALLIFRSGLSQMWFQRSTAELVVLVSAWGLAVLLPNPLSTRTALRLAAVAATAGLAAYLIGLYLESGKVFGVWFATLPELVYTALTPLVILAAYLLLRRVSRSRASVGLRAPSLAVLLACILGLGSAHVYALVDEVLTEPGESDRIFHDLFAPGGVAAARWLARHSDPDAVVATNVHCLDPYRRRCDSRNFWVSAYTARRVVVEGWGYTAASHDSVEAESVGSHNPIPDPERLAINDAAFRHPSVQTVSRLVDTYQVNWLFVSKDYPVSLRSLSQLPGLLAKRFSNPNYVIFKVRSGPAHRSAVSPR